MLSRQDSTGVSDPDNVHKLGSHGNDVMQAEDIWAAEVESTNFSFTFCDGLQMTFSEMFPDSRVTEEVKLSRSKFSYLLGDGLGPHLERELIHELPVS